MKGQAQPSFLCYPDRVLYPLRRVGERGKRKVGEGLSWDVALDDIAAKLTAIKEKYGAESITGMRGAGPRPPLITLL